jgi:hypothetical protein
MALQPQIDGDEIIFEAAGQRQQPIVLARAEGEMDAFALGRVLLPVIEAKLALAFERDIETRRRAGRPAFVEPLRGGAVGVKRHAISGIDEAMRGEKAGLSGADDGNVAHAVLRQRCGR